MCGRYKGGGRGSGGDSERVLRETLIALHLKLYNYIQYTKLIVMEVGNF